MILALSWCCEVRWRWVCVGLSALALLLTGTSAAQGLEMTGGSAAAVAIDQEWVQDGASVLIGAPASAVAGQAVTVRTVLRFDEQELEQATGIWLAGLTSEQRTEGFPLALAWVRDTSGWWPKWNLQILATIPEGARGLGAVLEETSPLPRHSYEAFLSFDPSTGEVAVRVTDLTAGMVICAQDYQTGATRQALYPVTGMTFADDPSVSRPVVEAFSVHPLFTPVSMSLEVLAALEGSEGYIPIRLVEESEAVVVRVANPGSVDKGEYRVWVENGGGRVLLATLDAKEQNVLLPLDESLLALGESVVALEYVLGEEVVLRDTTTITVGSLSINVTPASVDQDAGRITGAARISSQSAVQALQMDVVARLYRLEWDDSAREYRHEVCGTSHAFSGALDVAPQLGEVVVPLETALPSEPGVWRIEYDFSVRPALGLLVEGAQLLVSTHAPAQIDPGQTYTIAVLPDTQYYVRSYPDILTRQAEWLAANAQSHGIPLMLHMGDITDNNSSVQWERARDRIGLLNGVVPYVLAVGNHDIAGGGREGRAGSLIDQYFLARSFPTLRGTYEAGSVANSYHTLAIGDDKYLVLSLEFGPSDGVLEWANQVVTEHPDHRVIVITHTYTSVSGSRVTTATSGGSPELVYPNEVRDTNNGEDMWRKLVRKHENILMVLSGHLGVSTIPYNVGTGDHGNRVFEFLVDFQGQPSGGNGWLALFEFRPDNTMHVQVYSPYLDSYKADTDKYRNGSRMHVDIESGRVRVY